MKKSNPRRAATGLLALSLSMSPALTWTAPIAAQEVSLLEDEAVTSISGLVNPVVQQFIPAAVSGSWKLTSDSVLAIAATEANTQSTRLAEIVRLISSEMKAKGLSQDFLSVRYLPADSASGSEILVDVDAAVTDASDSPEAYVIEISEAGVRLTGASEQGVLNGLHTIENLLITEGSLPWGTIVDYPDLAERRIHVDCGRKYISKDWFIRLIHEMSYMKINALQMHFSENLGFRIECETDPSIVSDEYLTKAEVREILEEARLYGVNVIPSFDSPGHVDQILKAHPEYGQISTNGTHYTSGLDVTNEEAVNYIKSLYEEYCELFAGCTDFHIGADEYMEFDRAPFTTIYRSVLNNFAVQKYGEGYTWKDAIAGYINEIAELVHDHGFTPRIFNDGVYYGENSSWETKQKIQMHDYIGVDFWSQMTWNSSIARLQNIIDKGHKKIYNFNSSFFYYVLRPSKPSDGREQHSFDNLNADKLIYNNWTPGQFSANTVADDSDFIAGCSIGIWCDIPGLVEEDVIQDDIAKEMRAMASKAWNTASPSELSYEDFRTMTDTLGHAGAWEKGTRLEEAPEVLPSGDLGKVILHYTDTEGNTLRADSVHYGLAGNAYSFGPADIYGYRPVSDATQSGVYSSESDAELTFVYELYTDWSALEAAVSARVSEESCMPAEWPAYAQALSSAEALLAEKNAHQSAVDEALSALNQAKGALKNIRAYALHTECAQPLPSAAYASGYAAYQAALKQAEAVAADFDASQEDIDAAKAALDDAKTNLVKVSSLSPEVSASLPAYSSYAYSRMFDGDTSTFAWFDGPQETGDEIVFSFPFALNMSGVRILSPSDTKDMDYIRSATVEISADGETWTEAGLFEGASRDATIEFEKQPVQKVRLTLNEDSNNWYKVCEVYFAYEMEDLSAPLQTLLQEAGNLNPALYTRDSFTALMDAMKDAQKALAENKNDPAEEQTALQAALDALVRKGDVSEEANKMLLNSAIAYVQSLSEEDLATLNTLVREELDAALANAIAVRDDASATQAEVNAAWQRLSDVIHMLGFTADKSALNTLIAQAEAVEKQLGAYEEEGQEEFLSALAHAREIAASDTALDESIAQAVSRLQAAMDALQEKSLDTTLLAWLISQVETAQEADYTPGTWSVFASALEESRSILAAPESQQQVDGAVLSLNEAYLQLRRVPSEELLAELNAFLQQVETLDFSNEPALQAECMILCEEITAFLNSPEASQTEGEALAAKTRSLAEKLNGLPQKDDAVSNKPSPDTPAVPEDKKDPVTPGAEETRKPDASADNKVSTEGSASVNEAVTPVKNSVKTASAFHGLTWMTAAGAALGALVSVRRRRNRK